MSNTNNKKNPSASYWKRREEEALQHYVTEEAEYDKRVNQIYTNMLANCQKEINAFYGRYADKEGISIAEAKKRVSSMDIKAYEAKAKRYVKDREFSKQANEEMRLYNATMRINRLEMLKANIGLELIAGSDDLEKFMEGILKGRTEAELARQAGILGKTIKNNAEAVHSIVNASFHNATFSDRIWNNSAAMKADLDKLIQSGLIAGKNANVLAKDLQRYFIGEPRLKNGKKGAKYRAEVLMRTELARVQTEAQKQSFIRNGFTQYQFITNGNCCDICADIKDKVFDVDKMMPGENAPPMHPLCKCSTAAYSDRKEYEAWLDYLEKGGTTADWEAKGKAQWEKAQGKGTSGKAFSFTPAKTIEEAIEYAKSQGVKYVEYGNLPLETINELNKALGTLPEDMRPIFIGDSRSHEKAFYGTQHKLPRKHSSFYGLTQDSTAFGMYFKGSDGIYRVNYDEGGQMVAISSVNNTTKKITESKKAAQEKYRAKYGKDWFFNETGETTATHEMGHVYANVRGLPEGFEYAARAWATSSKCDMLNTPSEAWAEAWASYHTGINIDKVPEEVLEYIRKASGK